MDKNTPPKKTFEIIIKAIDNNHYLALVIILFFSVSAWIAITFWKYHLFLYDALDLAIYSQVFWNTSYGRLFEMSIHPQSYLGDHFEPLILLLTPIYAIWRDPRMLLILQTIFIHLAAIPLYLLAKNIFQKNESLKHPRSLALLIVLAFIFNPFVHNALIFEFHLLPFFLLPFFWTLYFAERGRLWPFLISIIITLTVREDIPFMVALAGLAVVLLFPASTKQRRLIWIVAPFILAVVWFILSLKIIGAFSPAGEYKFAIYYTPLQGDWWQTLKNVFLNPGPLLSRVLAMRNVETLAGLMLPFSFLPFGAPTSLLLGLLPYLQFATLNADSREVLVLHYGVLFLPALFLATILTINKLASWNPQYITSLLRWPKNWPLHLGVLFLASASFYGTATPGPLKDWNEMIRAGKVKLKTIQYAYDLVQNHKTIIATNSFLTRLSNRQYLYPLKYILNGQQQLSNTAYSIPGPVDAMILDQDYLLHVSLVLKNGELKYVSYNDRAEHLGAFVQNKNLQPVWAKDGIVIFRNSVEPNKIVPLIARSNDSKIGGITIGRGIKLLATASAINKQEIKLEIDWNIDQPIDENYFIDLRIEDKNGYSLAKFILDPGWGITPTSSWQSGTTITSYFTFSRPPNSKKISFYLFPTNEMIKREGGLRIVPLQEGILPREPIMINLD